MLDVWMATTNWIEVQERQRERFVPLHWNGAIAFLVKPLDDEVFLALVPSALPRIEQHEPFLPPDQKMKTKEIIERCREFTAPYSVTNGKNFRLKDAHATANPQDPKVSVAKREEPAAAKEALLASA